MPKLPRFLFLAAALAVAVVPSAAMAADAATPVALPRWLTELVPIALLLLVIGVVVARLPTIDVGHSPAFRRRRVMNWLPLGLTYAFLYMGRYNLTAYKDVSGLTGEQFGTVFAAGTFVYGLSFVINGPLTDRWGGRVTILIAALGSAAMNLALGALVLIGAGEHQTVYFALIYGANMYFQSFGAVAIVKVNSSWFHVRERGVFGGIFGILISLGVYFAFDWGYRIANIPSATVGEMVRQFVVHPPGGVLELYPLQWVFWVPAVLLIGFAVLDYFLVFDQPSDAGFVDFDTADASSGDDGPRLPAWTIMRRMMTSPVIVTIALVEFCSGFLRNAIMHWYRDFAKGMSAAGMGNLVDGFVFENWGMLLCIAGICGGMFAGLISDRVFGSRRGPVAGVLYALMIGGALMLIPAMDAPFSVGWIVIFMTMSIIGVHGMLSGTASQDFGGKKNAGVAVGIIDGFVYLGTGLHAILLGQLLPAKGTPEAADPASWSIWPLAMLPFAVAGFVLALRVWNARPQPLRHSQAAKRAP